MDLLQSYAEDKDDDLGPQSSPESSPPRLLPSKSAAPKVDDTTLALTVAQANQTLARPIDPSQHAVAFNPTYDQLWAPVYGPAHPYAKDGSPRACATTSSDSSRTPLSAPSSSTSSTTRSRNMGTRPIPLLPRGMNIRWHVGVYNIRQQEQKQKRQRIEQKREDEGQGAEGPSEEADPAEFDNPATDSWLMKNKKSPWAGKKEGLQTELMEEQKKYAEEYAKKKGEERGEGGREKAEVVPDKSTFHGKEIIRAGRGLRRPRMPRRQMIIVIYPRDWCTLGVGTPRACLLLGSSPSMGT